MYSACPRTRLWLSRTFLSWSQTPCRLRSTTSAIKHGLRADSSRAPQGRKDNGIAFDRRGSVDNRSSSANLSRSTTRRWGEQPPKYVMGRERASKLGSKSDMMPIGADSHVSNRSSEPQRGSARNSARQNDDQRQDGSRENVPNFDDKGQRLPLRSRKGRGTSGGERDVQRSSNSRGQKALQGQRKEPDDIPVAIPYTTSASVFIYGAHSVFSALQARRRKAYKLHMMKTLDGTTTPRRDFRRLAEAAKVPIVGHEHGGLLDKMANRRPHNGVVLEASQLPTPPVLHLGPWDQKDGTIKLWLDDQSAEDEAINGASDTLPISTKQNRHPLVVLLDGITDPGNVGSILRTCYFYGVDAVAISVNTCANLTSPTLAKASSGACEAIPILALPKPSTFALYSRKAGWRLFAAVAPDASRRAERGVPQIHRHRHHTTESPSLAKALDTNPCILMLGAEDVGLRENLRNKATDSVSIENGRPRGERMDMGIDSVNVSVAAGALLEAFLRPRRRPPMAMTETNAGHEEETEAQEELEGKGGALGF